MSLNIYIYTYKIVIDWQTKTIFVFFSKKKNTREREDELNSIISNGASLVVGKIGSGVEKITQSSTQQQHPGDAFPLGDTKALHVRTNWAAKYLK